MDGGRVKLRLRLCYTNVTITPHVRGSGNRNNDSHPKAVPFGVMLVATR